MKHDILKLAFLPNGTVQEIKIKRGSLEVGPGCISYIFLEDEEEASNRAYIPLHNLQSFRYFDHSRTNL